MAVGKADVVRETAKRTGMTQADVQEVIDNLPHVMRDLAIENQDDKGNRIVNIPGFIKVELKWKEARTGRNPQTGGSVDIPAKWSLEASSLPAYRTSVFVNSDDDSEEAEESAEKVEAE